MTAETLEEYLSGLLGQKVEPDSQVRLTSGQRARMVSWAESKGLSVDRSVIGRAQFTLREALSEGAAQPRSPIAPREHPPQQTATVSSVGIDIQRIDELVPLTTDFKSNDEIAGIFSRREISYAETRTDTRESLAGLFAAKEAIRKADSVYMDVPLPEIEVLPDGDGKPTFSGFSISISHSGEYAVACAAKSGRVDADSRASNSRDPAPAVRQKATQSVSGEPGPSRAGRWPGRLRLMLIILASVAVGTLIPDII